MDTASTHTQPRRIPVLHGMLTFTGTAVRMAQGAMALIAVHIVDDSFLQPNPGTSAGAHIAGGVVPLVLLIAAALPYARVRPGTRGLIALLAGYVGVIVSSEAVYYTAQTGPSGDDYTGLPAAAAGLLLVGSGVATLWRSRRRDDRVWVRYLRRLLLAGGTYLVASVVLFPLALAYVLTHVATTGIPEADLGRTYQSVHFRTADHVRLAGWYVPSRNGAAVVVLPGRETTQTRAKLLAEHGYGVLLFDRRGEGFSEGDPNQWGWQGAGDVEAAVAYLDHRPDVDPGRVGGIGLSVGGEVLIDAAAHSRGLKAIVPEGASSRSIRDDLANPGGSLEETIGDGVTTIGTAVFSSGLPPSDLLGMIPKIKAATLFIYGEHGQPSEEPANRAFYKAARGPKALWKVPGSGHTGGLDAQPREYERRVIAFFDRELLGT